MKLGKLVKAGIGEPWRVPLYLPTSYIDCTQVFDRFDNLPTFQQDIIVVGRYMGDMRTQFKPSRFGGKSSPLCTGTIVDGYGRSLKFSFFGRAQALEAQLESFTDSVFIRGTLNFSGGQLYLNAPTVISPDLLGKIVPVYPGVPRVISADSMRRMLAELLDETIPLAAERIRGELHQVVQGKKLRDILHAPPWTLDEVLRKVHWPSSLEEAEIAQDVLERVAAIISVLDLRNSAKPVVVSRAPLIYDNWECLLEAIPFKLTAEQLGGIEHLVNCFAQPVTSTTLINGDVGMGKSIIYQVAIAAVAKAGGRSAVLLPNERLALQAHEEIQGFWPELAPTLVSKKTKEDLTTKSILVGTTALLFREIGHLDVCVTDEQHRFSVEQRIALANDKTHLVELSATPIPRTQAMLSYGSMNVVRLTERHSVQDIHTEIVTREQAREMVEHIKNMVMQGDRILIVCPRKEQQEILDEETIPLPSVHEVAEKWGKIFPGKIRVVHSDTPDEESKRALRDIKSGQASVIVATTVLECGLTIEGLRALVVVHAERFGVAQLHQLRGRLSRHGGYGICYLFVPRKISDRSFSRLLAVASTNDGFKLSELDMNLRGFGDLSIAGERQHGSATSLFFNKDVSVLLLQEMIELIAA
jgi:ATP-dependent DNA helicase RecG